MVYLGNFVQLTPPAPYLGVGNCGGRGNTVHRNVFRVVCVSKSIEKG